MAAERNIEIYQGDTYAHQLSLKDSANAVINISTRSYAGQIRKKRSSNTVTATFTTQITDGANGVVAFSLAANITSNIASGSYVYDFQETNGSTVTTLITGVVTVVGEVSR